MEYEKLKKVKLQSLRKQYENMRTNDGEVVTNFFSRLVLTNQMKSCGKQGNYEKDIEQDLQAKFFKKVKEYASKINEAK